jgi:N-acyl-L-homoserine lactone synthetase
MIDLVLPECRLGFAGALMQMHRDRKRVFVDRLGWALPIRGSWLEVDEFDSDHAVYLLARGPDGTHQGSLRLLPSTGPHMLRDLFPTLCAEPVPQEDSCWEISRLVTNPIGASGTSILRVHRLLALALLEFAALNGIETFSLLIEVERLAALLSVGWPVLPLGMPMEMDGQLLQAFQIQVDAHSLGAMRARFGISQPVLTQHLPQRQAA